MTTAEETVDLKEALGREDLPIATILELRRTIHCSIERRGEMERLMEDFPAAVKKLGSDNKVDTRRATALWLLGRVEESIPLFEKARASKEKSYLLGLSLLEGGRYAAALEQLKEAYDGDSSDVVVATALAEAQVYNGQYEQADTLIDRIVKKHPEQADAYYARGLWHDLQGRRAEAIESYEKAMECEPGHARSTFRLAYLFDLHGEDARSMELYEQLRKSRPLHVNTMINLGVLYEDAGEFDKALECYRAVADYFPGHRRAALYVKDASASLNMFYDEDAIRREAKIKAVLTQPLADVTFSQRVRNALASLGIVTIGDLAHKSEEDFLNLANFGKTSLREIKEFLASKGLSFSTGAKPEGAALTGDVNSQALTEFDWSGRIAKLFEKMGLKTVGDLLAKSEADLMENRNLGITSIKEIRKKLGALGVAMPEK